MDRISENHTDPTILDQKHRMINMDIQDRQDKGTIQIRPFRKSLQEFPAVHVGAGFKPVRSHSSKPES